MVKSLLIRSLSAGLSTHQVLTVRLLTDRLMDGVALTSARESRRTPHGHLARRVRTIHLSSERKLGMARAGLKALLLPRRRIESWFSEGLHGELASLGVDVIASAPGPVKSGFADRGGMKMGLALRPAEKARATLNALGRKTTIVPGFLSKVLTYPLLSLPCCARVRIMGLIMEPSDGSHGDLEPAHQALGGTSPEGSEFLPNAERRSIFENEELELALWHAVGQKPN
jgi:hypothetical protein